MEKFYVSKLEKFKHVIYCMDENKIFVSDHTTDIYHITFKRDLGIIANFSRESGNLSKYKSYIIINIFASKKIRKSVY